MNSIQFNCNESDAWMWCVGLIAIEKILHRLNVWYTYIEYSVCGVVCAEDIAALSWHVFSPFSMGIIITISF